MINKKRDCAKAPYSNDWIILIIPGLLLWFVICSLGSCASMPTDSSASQDNTTKTEADEKNKYVNLNKVLNDSSHGRKAKVLLNNLIKEQQNIIDMQVKKIRNLSESSAATEVVQEEISKYRELTTSAQKYVKDFENKMTDYVLNYAEATAKLVAKNNNFNISLDQKGNLDDISNTIIMEFDKNQEINVEKYFEICKAEIMIEGGSRNEVAQTTTQAVVSSGSEEELPSTKTMSQCDKTAAQYATRWISLIDEGRWSEAWSLTAPQGKRMLGSENGLADAMQYMRRVRTSSWVKDKNGMFQERPRPQLKVVARVLKSSQCNVSGSTAEMIFTTTFDQAKAEEKIAVMRTVSDTASNVWMTSDYNITYE